MTLTRTLFHISLTASAAVLACTGAQAAQVSLFGGSNINNLDSVTGLDGMGDIWETHNGPQLLNSSFGMADHLGTPEIFNPLNFSNGNGSYVTSFQLTINNSQASLGFRGINTAAVASGLGNHFTVHTNPTDASTWLDWNVSYNLLDAVTSLYQQVLFTAPVGTRLLQGVQFATNVNFSGIMTNDSGWAASFSDAGNLATNDVPEPGALALSALGLLGLVLFRRGAARPDATASRLTSVSRRPVPAVPAVQAVPV
jgi:hypothetical protein